MKRDLDIVRRILEDTQANDSERELQFGDSLEAYHVALMLDAGLIEGQVVENGSGLPYVGIVLRLTWVGEDFLAAARVPKLWTMAKEHLLKPGATWSLAVMMEYFKAEILKALGT